MHVLYQRKFNVEYFEKDEQTWRIVSHLADEHHDIIVDLDILVPDMIIRNASIKFHRYPLEQCLMIEKKAAHLIGLNIMKDYRRKVLELFMGPEGCPNLMHLLGVSVPGIAYFYYPHQLKTGKMNEDEWMDLVKTDFANDCLAHTQLSIAENQQAIATAPSESV